MGDSARDPEGERNGGERALEGVRVLDLTRVVAGPFATALLADLGAEVIKVERPGTGDDYRYGPSEKGRTSLSFQNVNRGKLSNTLDVRKAEGRALLLRLCEGADVLVENFRSGFLDAQGLDSATLQARNPRLVVASLAQAGPLLMAAGWDDAPLEIVKLASAQPRGPGADDRARRVAELMNQPTLSLPEAHALLQVM